MFQNRDRLKNKELKTLLVKSMLKNITTELKIEKTTKLKSIYLFLKNDANDFP